MGTNFTSISLQPPYFRGNLRKYSRASGMFICLCSSCVVLLGQL